MTAAEYRAALESLGLSINAAGRWLGVSEKTGKNYAKDGKFTLYKPKGCPACNDSGYKGRVGLHELMIGSDPVKKLIQEHARVADLLARALEDGMLTLKMDGMQKVLQGLTDMHIVRSVCIK